MTFSGLLDAIQRSDLSQLVAGADHLVTAGLQVVHIVGFVLLLASATLYALRIFGLIFGNTAASAIARDAYRLMALGLLLAFTTGTLMVIGAPHHYFENPAFQVKLLLLLLAALAQLVSIIYLMRPAPRATWVRVGVGLSAVLWLGVAFAGRAIGFV